MLQKNYVNSTLIFGLMLLFVACSKPQPQPVIPFTPIGTWEMVSIDNTSVQDHFALSGGNIADIETKISQNDFIFFSNGSWYWTLELDILAKLGESGVALIPKVTLAARGLYTQEGMTLILALENLDVQLKPEEFWASAGVTKEAYAKEITAARLFGKIERWDTSVQGRNLTLRNTNGITQVLRKQ